MKDVSLSEADSSCLNMSLERRRANGNYFESICWHLVDRFLISLVALSRLFESSRSVPFVFDRRSYYVLLFRVRDAFAGIQRGRQGKHSHGLARAFGLVLPRDSRGNRDPIGAPHRRVETEN